METKLNERNGLRLILIEYNDGGCDIKVGDVYASFVRKAGRNRYYIHGCICDENAQPVKTYKEALKIATDIATQYFDDLFKGCTQPQPDPNLYTQFESDLDDLIEWFMSHGADEGLEPGYGRSSPSCEPFIEKYKPYLQSHNTNKDGN